MDEILRRLYQILTENLHEYQFAYIEIMTDREAERYFSSDYIPSLLIASIGEKYGTGAAANTIWRYFNVRLRIWFSSFKLNDATLGINNIYQCSDKILQIIANDKQLYDQSQKNQTSLYPYLTSGYVEGVMTNIEAVDYDVVVDNRAAGIGRDLFIEFGRLENWDGIANPQFTFTHIK